MTAIFGGSLFGWKSSAVPAVGNFSGPDPEARAQTQTAIFGGSMFGWKQSNIPAWGTIVSAEIIDAILQKRSTALLPTATATIGGVPVENLLFFRVGAGNRYVNSVCQITFAGGGVRAITGQELVLSFAYTLSTGASITAEIFRGRVDTFSSTTGGRSKTTQVVAYDLNKAALDAPPINSSWNGTATALVADELAGAGVFSSFIDFDDYSINQALQFSTVRALLETVVKEKADGNVISLPDGTVLCLGRDRSIPSFFSLSSAGVIKEAPVSLAGGRFNRVSVQGATGVSKIVNDTVDQADLGVQQGPAVACLFHSIEADLTTIGGNYIIGSKLETAYISTPLNPFLKPGDEIPYSGEDIGPDARLKILGKTSYFGLPGGAWDEILGVILL